METVSDIDKSFSLASLYFGNGPGVSSQPVDQFHLEPSQISTMELFVTI